jgi:hypothetical protein
MSPRAGSTVFTVRVIECAELIAADLFRNAEQNRRRIVFGDVECYLAQLAAHSRSCTCGRCSPRISSGRRWTACRSGCRAARVR